ncbi:MAG: hypothetical protein JKY19_09835 [Alcanivoracaceae bacterium]|nr:hypothetical protein [Alcanivoracaceae bacterium]
MSALKLAAFPTKPGSNPFLLYPDVNSPQVLIYCVPNAAITPPTSLSSLIDNYTKSSQTITTIQVFFFSSSFTPTDFSTILSSIKALKNNEGSFIAWIDSIVTEIPTDALTGVVKLNLKVEPGNGLPGEDGHIILSDEGPFPLLPVVAHSSLNNGISLGQSTPTNKFRIISNSNTEDNCLQIECKSDQAILSFGASSNSILTIDNVNGNSSNEYFAVFNIPLVLVAENNNAIGTGIFYNVNNVTISMSSVENGPCFQYSLIRQQGNIDSKAPASSTLKYPILTSDKGLHFDKSVHPDPTVYINPLKPCPKSPTEEPESYIEIGFSINAPSIDTSFRTVHGDFITFEPTYTPPAHGEQIKGSLKFTFNCALDGYSSLMPVGSYTIRINRDSVTTGRLLCGLSGTESIEFCNDNKIIFYAGQASGVYASIETGSSGSTPAIALKLSKDTKDLPYTTARVMIFQGQAKPADRIYYSEGDKAPFFATTSGSDLNYHKLSRSKLPPSPSDGQMFPIVPYYSVVQDTHNYGSSRGFGFYPEYLEVFEFQVLNPCRQNAIEAMNFPYVASNTDTVYALTPQGYQATFVNGVWTEIKISKAAVTTISNVEVEFSSTNATTPLPDVLQKAFLTNQQFFVMTTSVNGNLDGFKASIMLSDWSFGVPSGGEGSPPILKMPTSTTPGNYTNILLFKSGNTTIKQMAKNPHLWTQYAAFNDTTSDVEGNFLSNWLVEYLKNAEELYDNGNGVTSFASFCSLINDKNWNGFLALKIKVGDIATLPVDVQALVSDISGDLYAHHLGNEINHVKPPESGTGPYDLNSPFFGLIHYVNPNFASEVKNPPPYIQSANEHEFTVLTLEVVFEKVLETHFANKSMLMMNTFFGDQVLQTGPDGKQGANNLILIGTYHHVDNVPSYSFSTAAGITTDFYLSSNAFNVNRISNVTMNVVKLCGNSEDTDIYKASFAIRGSFDFLNDSDFDLLSYEYLPYYGLSMDVTIQHNKTNIYEMDFSKLNFEKNQTEPLAAGSGQQPGQALNIVRTGSLVAQFPMKLKGLVRNVGSVNGNSKPDNASPAEMGYRLLQTATPKGISFSSPSGGEGWYGLEFDVVLGGQGSLASGADISASIIIAWVPGGIGSANASPQFKLSGPGGISLSFDFEGVLKFGAKDIVLNRYIGSGKKDDPDYFYMIFQSIALSLLSISFPPGDTTNVMLMGDTTVTKGSISKPTLSWFGGYAKEGS